MCECRARGSSARSLAGSLSCCTFLQHPKGLQHEQDQTHAGELAWALGEEVSHTLCPNGSISPEACGHPGAGTAGPRLARAAALSQRSPFPPSFPSLSPLPVLSQRFPQAFAMLCGRAAAVQPPASPGVFSTKFSLEDGSPLASKESLVPRTEASNSLFNWYKGILYSV